MTTRAGERRIVLLPEGSGRRQGMARKKQTILVCDGCSKELVEEKGTSRVTIDVFEGPLRKADFCVECTTKLPEGTERKRPGARPKK